MRYKLEITQEQANVIQRALELYGRVAMGQLEEVVHVCTREVPGAVDLAKQHLDIAKYALTGLTGGAYIGIHGTSEQTKIGWDIYQVIRHRISWDRNPAGGMTTNYDEPMHYSNTQKLPIMNSAE